MIKTLVDVREQEVKTYISENTPVTVLEAIVAGQDFRAGFTSGVAAVVAMLKEEALEAQQGLQSELAASDVFAAAEYQRAYNLLSSLVFRITGKGV